MAGQADPPLRRATAAAVVAATLAGFGCMAAELTAVRLLAPHFGDSAYVWTNVIGVILAALAAGAWLGGRLAARADPAGWAARCLVAAGLLVASAPWVAGGLGSWLVPAELPLDAAMPVLVRASFVATVLLFAPAMACLGAVSPLLVTSAVRGGGDVGRSVGAISAAGTIGSLLGTF
ncbi:MAG: fused MFS/spermidine synthase, partial [Planctomycetota bacterium]